MKSTIRRLTARLATTALVGTLALSGVTAAHAWTFGAVVGTLSLNDPIDLPNGLDSTPMTWNTSGPCDTADDPQATNAQILVLGAGFPVDGYNVTANNPTTILPTNADGGYSVGLLDTMQNFALAQTPPAVLSGEYDFVLVCKHPVGFKDDGDYKGSVWFYNPTHYQSVAPAATTTSLTASPANPVAGTPTTLTAAVSPASATGTVTFLDGATTLGTAAVTAGAATLVTSSLAVGAHSLTASFASAGPPFNLTSVSSVLSIAVGAATPAQPVLPVATSSSAFTVPVGTAIGCGAGATWQRDGASVGAGTSYVAKAADVGHSITCSVGGVAGPAAVVVPGAPLRPLVAPSLRGTGKVGSKLTLNPGVWSPALVTRSVVWQRDGKVVARQTGPSYTVTKADKGHKISAVVTAHRPGYADGTAATSGVAGRLAADALPLVRARTAGLPMAAGAVGFTVPVGTQVGCIAGAFTGATSVTSTLLVDAAPTGSTTLTVSAADLGHSLTCRTTAVAAGGSSVSDAVATVAVGEALSAYVKPRVTGSATVGHKLSAAAGKWTPAYAKATFVWLRDGKPIKGATKATYTLVKADKRQRISVRVQVSRTGWGNGTATSSAVSVG